jgi:solute carrier family 25 iron transporter 28/37
MSSSSPKPVVPQHHEEEDLDLEWEEWDGRSPFLHHCIAGSVAGVAEHVLLYPVDTVKTHMQAYCSVCPNNPDNIASPSASTKPVCTGPPSNMNVNSTGNAVFRQHSLPQAMNMNMNMNLNLHASTSTATTVSNSASQSHAPHSMWSTMSNLINHGHSSTTHHQQLQPKHHATATRARQSATLALNQTTSDIIADTSNTKNANNFIKNNKGYTRLWRGVQTMTTGCIPAHALYFSSYEYTKSILSTTTTSPQTGEIQTHLHPIGASIAGAISAFFHDCIMTPMDTIKQRMQLGHYESMSHAFQQIIKLEGWRGLYRSFNVTVMTNLPYGMIMVSTNEFLRDVLLDIKRQHRNNVDDDHHHKRVVLDLQTTMLAGCGAGMVAAAVTAPLDRVKTRLQTQRMLHTATIPTTTSATAAAPSCPKANAIVKASMDIAPTQYYNGFMDTFSSIVKEEGYVGLWRGLVPRLMTHTPAVAISWTAYEGAKRFLHEYF